MDLDVARSLAQATLKRLFASEQPLQLVDDELVADVGWGFVFAWNSQRWFETRNPAEAIGPSAGPIVIIKDTDEVFMLGSAPSIDEQLRDYAMRRYLPEPPMLAW